MSELRKQLQSLKREYQSARYPGDLAEEMLQPRRPMMRIFGYATLATGIAAAVLISLLHTPTINVSQPPGRPTALAVATAPAEEEITTVAELSTIPEFPAGASLVPSGDYFVPSSESMEIGAMPAFGSYSLFDTDSSETSTTTKEPA